MYLKCPKSWRFRYVDGVVTPPKAALTVGNAVDSAVTNNLIQKLRTGVDLSQADVIDVYSTDFDVRAKETAWGDDDAGKQKDMGVKLITAHHEQLAPKIDPATVQEKFRLETDMGYDLGGTIDLTEKDGTVADTKTSKNAYAEDAISRALQPALYDFAFKALYGQPAKAFRYDVLIKPTVRNPVRVQQITAKVTPADTEWLFDTINNVHKAITAGVDSPAPDGAWWCGKDWCGFWSMCKGKDRK